MSKQRLSPRESIVAAEENDDQFVGPKPSLRLPGGAGSDTQQHTSFKTNVTPIKILVVGDHKVGKTSFIFKYCYDFYTGHNDGTVGVDYHTPKTQPLAGYQLQLWDLVGSDRIGGIAGVYFKRSVGAILVTDIKHRDLKTVERWIREIDNNVRLPDGRPIPKIVILTRHDLGETDSEEVKRDMEAFIGKHHHRNGVFAYSEISSLLGDVNEPVDLLLGQIMGLVSSTDNNDISMLQVLADVNDDTALIRLGSENKAGAGDSYEHSSTCC